MTYGVEERPPFKMGNPRRGFVQLHEHGWIPGWLIVVAMNAVRFVPDEDDPLIYPGGCTTVWVHDEPRKAKSTVITLAEWCRRNDARRILDAFQAAIP